MGKCFWVLAVFGLLVAVPKVGHSDPGRPRVVVMDFKPVGGVNADLLGVYSEKLLLALRSTESYEELGKSDFEAMIGYEKFKDAVGCDDVSCMAEIGGAAGVDLILTGTVLQDQGAYTVLAKLINTGRATIDSRVEHRVTAGVTALLESAEIVIAKAFGKGDWLQKITGGAIAVQCDESGVSILVDGEPKGKGPGTVFGISPGSHELEVKKEGYRAYRTNIRVEKGETATVKATLTELATLQVASSPVRATVLLDGEHVGETPLTLRGQSAGSHRLTLSAKGYGPFATEVALQDGEKTEVVAELKTEAEFLEVVARVREERASKKTFAWIGLGASAALGAGAGAVLVFKGDADSIRESDDAGAAIDRHNTMVVVGWSLTGAAAIALGFGVYKLVTQPDLPETSIAVVPTHQGVVLALGGGF